ncbi:hypothetical protein Bpfe_014958 [Biomphalaria pfeifferi]|uniref:Uncharacterized protein n=1 Tax=Biomphalaria pfeifferi TaxID=112525 RepID=A0AAD8F9J9_BIOPF|nr:hypothetical protein Bpfe_014958 [Biomphalaria pfeifferi]
MPTSGPTTIVPTTVSGDVHGKCPLTWCLKTTVQETTVVATISTCSQWLASTTIVMRSKQRPRYLLKRSLANWKKRKCGKCTDGFVVNWHPNVCGSH